MAKLKINRYRIKPDISLEDIMNEIHNRKLSNAEGGSYNNKNSYHCFWKQLKDDITVEIAIPKDVSQWDDFDYVLVLDESFGQPYTPFYESTQDFMFLIKVKEAYNKFMDSLDFLERKENE